MKHNAHREEAIKRRNDNNIQVKKLVTSFKTESKYTDAKQITE